MNRLSMPTASAAAPIKRLDGRRRLVLGSRSMRRGLVVVYAFDPLSASAHCIVSNDGRPSRGGGFAGQMPFVG
jgi:hypothetical protein